MNKYLDTYDLSKLNQEVLNLSRPMMSLNQHYNLFPRKKIQELDGFAAKFDEAFSSHTVIPQLWKRANPFKLAPSGLQIPGGHRCKKPLTKEERMKFNKATKQSYNKKASRVVHPGNPAL